MAMFALNLVKGMGFIMKKICMIFLTFIIIFSTAGCSISLFESKEECSKCDNTQQSSITNNSYQNYIKGLKNSSLAKEIANSDSDFIIELIPDSYNVPGISSLELNSEGFAVVNFDNSKKELQNQYPDGYQLPGQFVQAFGPLEYGNGGCYKFALVKEDGTLSLLDNCGFDTVSELSLKEVTTVKNVINVISVSVITQPIGASEIYAIDIDGTVTAIK